MFLETVFSQNKYGGPSHGSPAPAATTIYAWLASAKKLLNLPPSGTPTPLFPWICWNVWTARNLLVFEDKHYTPRETLSKAIKDAIEWSDAQVVPGNRGHCDRRVMNSSQTLLLLC